MSHIEILVPFGLPPAELANDLLRELALPALAMLLARGAAVPLSLTPAILPGDSANDDPARSLPHEEWLAGRFGMRESLRTGGSPPIAPALMQAMAIEPEPGCWFVVQPVHFHIARDHLVLTDLRELRLAEDDSRALFAAALPSFTDAGLLLRYGSADCWFMQADVHRDLQTATPDATCGRNIDIWMPKGASARAWRKLQNEVQMDWHAHDVNERRTMAGLTPVNSLWMWGGAAWPDSPRAPGPVALFGFDGWTAGFGRHATFSQATAVAADVLTHSSSHRLVLLDALSGAALSNDWSRWLDQMRALEALWFQPLLTALGAGTTNRISLVLSNTTDLKQWSATRSSLRKFWIRPTLTRLLP